MFMRSGRRRRCVGRARFRTLPATRERGPRGYVAGEGGVEFDEAGFEDGGLGLGTEDGDPAAHNVSVAPLRDRRATVRTTPILTCALDENQRSRRAHQAVASAGAAQVDASSDRTSHDLGSSESVALPGEAAVAAERVSKRPPATTRRSAPREATVSEHHAGLLLPRRGIRAGAASDTPAHLSKQQPGERDRLSVMEQSVPATTNA